MKGKYNDDVELAYCSGQILCNAINVTTSPWHQRYDRNNRATCLREVGRAGRAELVICVSYPYTDC